MSYPKPYSGASNTRLTAMINGANPRNIQLGVDFVFGPPEPHVGDGALNTRITLISLRPDKYVGDDWVIYRRLPLTVLNKLPDGLIHPVVVTTETFFIHDILADINSALGLDLVASEVENAECSASDPQVPLRIDENVSVAWIDSDFTFSVQYHAPGEDVPLSDLLTVTRLDGLYYPAFS